MTTTPSRADELDWSQLARFLAGELTPREARAFEHWFEHDARRRQLLVEARAAWAASAPPTGAWDVEAGIHRLREAAGAITSTAPAALPHRPLRRGPSHTPLSAWPGRRLAPAALAAALAALAVSGVTLWSWHNANATFGHLAPVAMNEIVTQRGQRAEVLLPDGSRVTLGVASRLRYSRDFGVSARLVQLDGEAYFDVVHDAARPFRVRAGAAELEDVGTEFVVRNYGSRSTRVVVADGLVMVRRPTTRDSVLLTAAQLAEVDERGIARRNGVRVDDYLAWRRGELVFDDVPLTAVAEELTRWYDVDIRVAASAAGGRHFTGSFRGRPLDAVIAAVAAAADVTAERVTGGWRFR